MEKPVILYLISEKGNFTTALPLLAHMQKQYGARGVLLMPYALPGEEEIFAQVESLGLCLIAVNPGGSSDSCRVFGGGEEGKALEACLNAAFPEREPMSMLCVKTAHAKFERIVARLGTEDAALAGEALHRFRWNARIAWRAKAVVLALKPRLLLMAEDQPGRDHFHWVRRIRKSGGKSAVISQGAVTPEEFHLYATTYPPCRMSETARAALPEIARRWGMQHEGACCLRLPVSDILAIEAFSVSAQNAWVINAGEYDWLIIESEVVAEAYAQHGLRRRKIRALGSPSFDILFEKMQSARPEQSHKRRLLWGLPPDNFGHVRAPLFTNYREFLERTLPHLSTPAMSETWELLITPHPNLDPELVALAAQKGRVVGPMLEGIAQGDLFLATNSSTIKWARAFGKPVIDYDVFEYRYDFLKREPFVERHNSEASFIACMQKLLAMDDARWNAYLEAAMRGRQRWGVVDGKALARIGSFLASALAEPSTAARMCASITRAGSSLFRKAG